MVRAGLSFVLIQCRCKANTLNRVIIYQGRLWTDVCVNDE
jgi:hypothetical protein